MVLEMLCLLLAPRNGGTTLMILCVINRICSGLSEACASGADEALAYDSLPEQDRENAWDHLLASAMRWRSFGYVIAMILGGMIYDPTIINRLLPNNFQLSVELAHRLPIAMVFCQALICLVTTLRMVEPPRDATSGFRNSCKTAIKLTLETTRWVFTNPKTLVVIVIGLAIDSIVRNFATINSSYYRLIEIPEWTFGFIGAALGLFGWFIPTIAKNLNARFSTLANLGIAAVVSLFSLAALVPAWRIFGLLPAMLLMTVLGFLGFTISRALHGEADSSRSSLWHFLLGRVFREKRKSADPLIFSRQASFSEIFAKR